MSGNTPMALTQLCRRRTGRGWSVASGRSSGLTTELSRCGAGSSLGWTVQSLALNRTPRAMWGSSWSWSASMTPGSCPGSDLGTPLSGPAAPGAAVCASVASRRGVPCASCASAGRTAAGAGAHHSGRMRAAGVTPAKSGSAGQSRQGSSQGIVIRSIGSSRGGLWRPLHGRGWTYAPIPLCPSCAQPCNVKPSLRPAPALGCPAHRLCDDGDRGRDRRCMRHPRSNRHSGPSRMRAAGTVARVRLSATDPAMNASHAPHTPSYPWLEQSDAPRQGARGPARYGWLGSTSPATPHRHGRTLAPRRGASGSLTQGMTQRRPTPW